MSARPVAALTEAVARQILAEAGSDPRLIAVQLADELADLGRWRANTCQPLLRAYEMARGAADTPEQEQR